MPIGSDSIPGFRDWENDRAPGIRDPGIPGLETLGT